MISARAVAGAETLDPGGLLTSYHEALARLFDQFASTSGYAERRGIAARICHLVSAQCDVEEEFLYPEASRGSPRPDNRVRAAQLEGAFVRKVVAEIRALDVDSGMDQARFAATVGILRDYLGDYLEQQRADVLPRLGRSGPRVSDLCQAMLHRRAEILAGSPGLNP
jgi:hypothetical protein